MTIKNLNAQVKRRAERLLQDVTFTPFGGNPYTFWVKETHGGVMLQASYEEPDVYDPTGPTQFQMTRKWLLSPHMTDSEIISTAFKCCLTSMEHRAREAFQYKAKRIYGPHFDIEDLVSICETRENAGGRQ